MSADTTPGSAAAAAPAADWTSAILDAITAPDRMRLVFQPIVDLIKGTVVGYEALTRFEGPPDAGPGAWFAAAATLGMGAALEAKAIGMALAAREQLPNRCFLSINVSPLLLADHLIQTTFTDGAPLSDVVVELTEHDDLTDLDTVSGVAAELRRLGARLALDDAGAGYSALQEMAAVSPAIVKLDRTVVDGIDTDPTKQALAHLTQRFAHRIEALVLAEGIERTEELDTFVALGIPLGQGHLFGRPAPEFAALGDELPALIRSARGREDRGDMSVSSGSIG